MILIESLQIGELRGIRNLTLSMNRGCFVVSGPNGSGKSGVVDAIQFALTGEIGRLKGSGTGDLKLSDHGPHVEMRDYPDASFVKLDVFIPHLGKSASITRKIKKPRQPSITPNDAATKAVFDEMARHPEITLSRREIIKFILSEASQRSRDVQTLLKLDEVDQIRATLKTTENKLNASHTAAQSAVSDAEASLKRHLDLDKLTSEGLLASVNKRRVILALQEIRTLTRETSVSEGILVAETKDGVTQSKESTLRDLKAVCDALDGIQQGGSDLAVKSIAANLAAIDADSELLSSIRRRSLVQSGLELIDTANCPLCDTAWDIDALRTHLREKLEKSKAAQLLKDALIQSGGVVANDASRLRGLLDSLSKIPEADKEAIKTFSHWSGNLESFGKALATFDGILANKQRFTTGWMDAPKTLRPHLDAITKKVTARPDKGAVGEARDFLVIAEERLAAWRRARREAEKKKAVSNRGKLAYKIYGEVSEKALADLYTKVEGDFSGYYQYLNHDDEGEFQVKFEPSDGRLGLLVDFHKKGMFPPGAYHSEGHQDGMGICLYLALMKRVLGAEFRLAVLDDVVMSVDSQHRKQFCKLLKAQFPDTQFIITTHDEVWARQMRSEGLISAKSAVAFHTWTVDTGPVLDEVAEVWDRIAEDLVKNEVPMAAARMRRHLEFISAELADNLAAPVPFRGDGGYDMGMLLGAVIGRQGALLKKAEAAAKSWEDADALAAVQKMQNERTAILSTWGGEQWIINKAIHYNDWANLSRQDFEPVVQIFRSLLDQFRCNKPKCDTWLALSPRIDSTDLRCPCGNLRLNLKKR